jgi:hypothetical protein
MLQCDPQPTKSQAGQQPDYVVEELLKWKGRRAAGHTIGEPAPLFPHREVLFAGGASSASPTSSEENSS